MTNINQKSIIIDANLEDDISNISLPNSLSEYFKTDKTYETNFIVNTNLKLIPFRGNTNQN